MSTKNTVGAKKKEKLSDEALPSLTRRIGDLFIYEGLTVNAILFLIFFNILIRFSVGLEGYSGNHQARK